MGKQGGKNISVESTEQEMKSVHSALGESLKRQTRSTGFLFDANDSMYQKIDGLNYYATIKQNHIKDQAKSGYIRVSLPLRHAVSSNNESRYYQNLFIDSKDIERFDNGLARIKISCVPGDRNGYAPMGKTTLGTFNNVNWTSVANGCKHAVYSKFGELQSKGASEEANKILDAEKALEKLTASKFIQNSSQKSVNNPSSAIEESTIANLPTSVVSMTLHDYADSEARINERGRGEVSKDTSHTRHDYDATAGRKAIFHSEEERLAYYEKLGVVRDLNGYKSERAPVSVVDKPNAVHHDWRDPIFDFNKSRRLSPCDENGNRKVHQSSNGFRYEASVDGLYALSDEELNRLDTGEPIVIPSYVARDSNAAAWFKVKLVDTDDKDFASHGYNKGFVLEEIDVNNPLIRDADACEYYAMHKDGVNLVLSAMDFSYTYQMDKMDAILEKGGSKNSVVKAGSEPNEPRITSRHYEQHPTSSIKALSNTGNVVAQYQNSTLQRSFEFLRQEPVSKKGKELGFETAWDEKHTKHSSKLFQRGLERSLAAYRELSSKAQEMQNKNAIERGIDALISVEGNDVVFCDFKSNLNRLSDQQNDWKDWTHNIEVEYNLRSTPCKQPGSEAMGLRSAWEEKVLTDYNAVVEKFEEQVAQGADPSKLAVSKEFGTDEVKNVLYRKMRLDETLDIRKYGENYFDMEVSKSTDRSQIGVTLLDGSFDDTYKPDFA